ncbi:HAD-IB family hydrolase [Streptomyces sp. NPDC102282]|uniref:HAD-IB family hydrolase n=1 Tax=Streptomyces sp. NPDC102282 TaxID=3366154 RepID=UPI0037F4C132
MNPTRRTTRAAAFFDVDGTLVNTTTMFEFLAYHLNRCGRPDAYRIFRKRIADMARAGANRNDRCHAYYEMYADVPLASLTEEGAQWFTSRSSRPGFFNESAVAEFRTYAATDTLTVLVSGSFAACLNPIAEYLGADVLLCSRPEVEAGVLTGSIGTPMIGAAKLDAVLRLADRRSLNLEQSHAYGDHISDAAYMGVVGHPVVVGDDNEMAHHAAQHRWRRLAGSQKPDPLTDRIRP